MILNAGLVLAEENGEGKSTLESRIEEVQQRRAEEEAEQAAQEEQANSYPVAVGRSLDARKTMAIKYKGKLEWSSSDEAVATVSPRGDVKGISAGKAVITAKSVDDAEVNESITVSVVVPIKKISLSEKNLEIPVDMTWNLTASITPEDATNQKLEWSSSNEKIATVDQNGLVTGKSIGKTKITAAATDGSKAKAVINLKVDKFDVVIDGMGSAKQTLFTNHFGGEYIKAKTKNKVVDVKLYGTSQSYTSGGIQYGTTFEITAKKPGTDVITYSYGGSKTKSRVFVSLKYQTDQEALKKMFEEAEAEGQTGIISVYKDEDGNLHKGSIIPDQNAENTEQTENTEKNEAEDATADEKYHKESRVDSKINFRKIPWGISVQDYLNGDYGKITEYGAANLKDAGVYQVSNSDFAEEVAGWPVELVYLWFTKQYDESGNIIEDEGQSLFYHAAYRIDAGFGSQTAIVDLSKKLTDIYGSPISRNKWEDNGVTLELGTMGYSTVTISYTWLEGEKINKEVEKLIKDLAKQEKQKELEDKSNNVNGL